MTQTLLVTGANRGIGLEFVKHYAENGWRVIACCRHPEMAKTLSALAKTYAMISIFPLDMMDETAILRVANQLKNEPIDILLNNAGVSLDDENGFGSVTASDWLKTMQVNALAPVLVVRPLLIM